MILHGFAWRSSKNTILGPKTFKVYQTYFKHQENIKNFERLYIKDGFSFLIEETLIRNKKLSIKLEGIEDRTAAEPLRSKEVYVLEDQLPNLEKGEYYWYQLKDLEVINQQNELLGVIDYLMPTGANDVLVVKPVKGSIDDKERLIPFMKEEIIIKVEVSNKIVQVKWPRDF